MNIVNINNIEELIIAKYNIENYLIETKQIEENKLTLTITSENVDKLDTVQDILQQFCSTIRNSSKRTNNEEYAQKTVNFEKKVKEMNDAIDEIKNPQNEEE